MTRKIFAIFGIIAMLLLSTFSPAAAQDEPPAPPVGEPEAETDFLTHPVVLVLSEYFGNLDDDGDPATPPTTTPEAVAAEIAGYHADGMGFGVLVKLYSMVEASKINCKTTGCTPVTIDELIGRLNSGEGMGALMKEYKPAMKGVGHVKQELKKDKKADQEDENGNVLPKDKKDKKPKKDK